MKTNFYSNILEGGSDFAKSNYIEGGKKINKTIGFVDEKTAKKILEITNHDFFTTFVFEVYLSHKNRYNETEEKMLEILRKLHDNLVEYNKTSKIFTIENFDIDDGFGFYKKIFHKELSEGASIFDMRNEIIELIKKMGTQAYKNCKDKDDSFTYIKFKYYKEELLELISDYNDKLKEMPNEIEELRFYNSVFKSGNGLKEWIEVTANYEKIDNLTKEKLKELIDNTLKNTEIVFETKDYTFLKVKSQQDISWIGCHTEWCVAKQKSYWEVDYKIDFVYVLINWKSKEHEPDFKYIIGKPFIIRENFHYINILEENSAEGFFDGDGEKLSIIEIRKVWSPFMYQLSKGERIKLLSLDNITISYLARLYSLSDSDVTVNENEEIIINDSIEIKRDIDDVIDILPNIKLVKGDFSIYPEDNCNIKFKDLKIEGNFTVHTNKINVLNLPNVTVNKNFYLEVNSIRLVKELPKIKGTFFIKTKDLLEPLSETLDDSELNLIEQI